MQTGKRRPIISPKSVEAALNSLIYTTSDTSAATALRSLALVDDYLQNPARPPARDLRGYALKAIVCNIITENLHHFRQVSSLAPAAENTSMDAEISRIAEDSRSGNPEFLGWSYLYYRYVRVDLGIGNKQFEQYSNLEREWQMREQNHHRRLQSAIPGGTDRLIHRTQELQMIFTALHENVFQPIYITGAPGIGKTAVARIVTRHLVKRYEYDYVFWIEHATDVTSVAETILAQVAPQYVTIRLEEVFLTWKCLVILDDYLIQSATSQNLVTLLSLLANTTTIITSTQYNPLPHFVTHVHLAELPYEGVREFIEENYGESFPIAADRATMVDSVYNLVGGNPSALHLYMHQWIEGDDNRFTGKSLYEMYNGLYYSFKPEAQRCWNFFAMLGTSGLDVPSLEALLSSGFLERSGFVKLLNHFLLRSHSDSAHYALPQSAAHFVAQMSKADAQFQESLLLQLESFAQNIPSPHSSTLPVIGAKILLSDWLSVPGPLAKRIIEAYLQQNSPHQAVHLWWKVSRRYSHVPLQPAFLVTVGVFARKLHHYKEAFDLFQQVISDTGSSGEFALQRTALFEYAILAHRTGKYVEAIRILNRLIDALPATQEPSQFADQIYHELIDIFLEMQTPDRVEQYLQRITYQDTFRWHQQRTELLILRRDFRRAIASANAALLQFEDTLSISEEVSIFTALGRAYQQLGAIDKSINAFSGALDHAMKAENILLNARSKTNLAGVLLEVDQLNEAEVLLQDAKKAQEQFPDPVAAAATEKNLEILHRKRIKQNNNNG